MGFLLIADCTAGLTLGGGFGVCCEVVLTDRCVDCLAGAWVGLSLTFSTGLLTTIAFLTLDINTRKFNNINEFGLY